MPVALASTAIGHGQPALVLHGLSGSGTNWRTIARRLDTRLECHLVDQRNHGRSPHARGMAYPDLTADVIAYLEGHRIDRAGLIGHSMGGKTAMTLALTAPERVRWLIVADIAPGQSPSDHGPMLDTLKALPVDTLTSRTGADAALAAAVPDLGLRQFLLQNLITGGAGLRWRIDLDAIADALPDLTGFPIDRAGHPSKKARPSSCAAPARITCRQATSRGFAPSSPPRPSPPSMRPAIGCTPSSRTRSQR